MKYVKFMYFEKQVCEVYVTEKNKYLKFMYLEKQICEMEKRI